MIKILRYPSFSNTLRFGRNLKLCSFPYVNVIKRNYRSSTVLCEYSSLFTSYSHHRNGQLFSRYYTQNQAISEGICWNCSKATMHKNNMICAECGYLQDVNTKINYFDLLKCSQSFDVELQKLTHNFRQIQSIVHPDKYSNKSEREQRNSAEWSSLINIAYKTLLTPIDRGEYLLQLQGMKILDDNSAYDKEFLMKMMERNEEIEDATTEQELKELDKSIVMEINEKSAELILQFKGNDLNGAMSTLTLMKYLRRLRKSIKFKLQEKLT